VRSTVDAYEFNTVPDQLSQLEFEGGAYKVGQQWAQPGQAPAALADLPDALRTAASNLVETKPHFYEWATAYVGMIAVTRKQRSTHRNHAATETAAPVVVCAAGKGPLDEPDFQFAGVVRSNCVRTLEDSTGPTTDEFFTLTVGGPQTILNNSPDVIHAGDQISWTFVSEHETGNKRRQTHGAPRRVGIRASEFHDENRIGRAITFAKPGQVFDLVVSY
jgi:hypothetical protein